MPGFVKKLAGRGLIGVGVGVAVYDTANGGLYDPTLLYELGAIFV